MSKLSIIVPVYNVEKYVEKCLDSIVNQTLKDIEIIIVNDGSTDASINICKHFIEKDNRIKIINKENGGLMSAWMEGVRKASSDIIGFVDSDDWVDLEFFETLYDGFIKFEADMVVGNYVYDSADCGFKAYDIQSREYVGKERIKELTSLYLRSFLYKEHPISICRWDKLYKKDLLINNFKFLNTSISLGEDVNTNVAVLPDCNKITILTCDAKYHYRYNPKSIANTFNIKQIENISRLRETLIRISEEKSVNSNDISLFIGNMIFEETQKVYSTSMLKKEKYLALSSIMAHDFCVEDLKQYGRKKSIFHKIYIYFLTHKHFAICSFIKKCFGV